jgi:hypothetical protein
MATVRLSAESLDPTQITGIFLVQPDLAAKRGEGLVRKADRSRVPAKVGTWYITTRHRVLNLSPADHLAWVLQLIAPKLGTLRQTVPALNVNFSLLVHDAEFETTNLPPDLLKEVVSIGDLEIEVPERAMDVVLDSSNLGEYLGA